MSLGLRLPEAYDRFGLRWEALPGWRTRTAGGVFRPGGGVYHWTGGPRAATGRPSLRVVRDGRPGLPGPLCNDYLDRYGIVVLVAAGVANHAGVGGWAGLTGNSRVFGTEAEGTIDDLTEAQLATYPRVVAAHHWLTGTDPAVTAAGHHEWATPRGRKTDIGRFMAPIRVEASRLWRAAQQAPLPRLEAPMATPNEIWMQEVWHTHPDGSVEKHSAAEWVTHLAQRSARDHERLARLEQKQAEDRALLERIARKLDA